MKKRAESLVNTTLDVVAQDGLSGFTVKKVTQGAGVSETLIYKYFDSKEDLLWHCFREVRARLEAAVEAVPIPKKADRMVYYALAREKWEQYFRFLVRHPRDMRFFHEFVQSAAFSSRMDKRRFIQREHLTHLREVFQRSISSFCLQGSLTMEHIWTYILRTSEQFAEYAVGAAEMELDMICEVVWSLLSGGLRALM